MSKNHVFTNKDLTRKLITHALDGLDDLKILNEMDPAYGRRIEKLSKTASLIKQANNTIKNGMTHDIKKSNDENYLSSFLDEEND